MEGTTKSFGAYVLGSSCRCLLTTIQMLVGSDNEYCCLLKVGVGAGLLGALGVELVCFSLGVVGADTLPFQITATATSNSIAKIIKRDFFFIIIVYRALHHNGMSDVGRGCDLLLQ